MHAHALDARLIRWLVRLRLPIFSKLLVLVYARLTKSEWFGQSLWDFDSILSFKLRRGSFTQLMNQARLSVGVCAPVAGHVAFVGPLTHHQARPVNGAGFIVPDLLGGPLPELTSAVVIQMPHNGYQHIHAPCDMTVYRTLTLQGQIDIAPEVKKRHPALYSGHQRLVVIGATATGSPLVLVMIGSRYFPDVVCPMLEGFSSEHPVSFTKGESLGYFIQGSTLVALSGGEVKWKDIALSTLEPLAHIGELDA